ncbi:ATP-binding protein [Candidatus Ichthyocystis sparus]|uniref:ATP-binding protein n=1 Tax=Candidatus Ichthyocystis sparus TaxID=1561004 RepID=UPI000B891A01|nr:ATP-binding protein [Candidatus Ichthyocystis sparus]
MYIVLVATFETRIFLLGPGKSFYWEATDSDHGLSSLIDAFMLWADSALKDQDPSVVVSLTLVFDELYMNALMHGYKKTPTYFWVSIHAFVQRDKVIAIYRDKAVKFNPLLISTKDRDHFVDRPIEEIALGGLGIHIIRKFVDDISYSFVDDCNVVTVTKRLQVPGTRGASTGPDTY